MKAKLSAVLLVALTSAAAAHDLTGDPAHPHYDASVRPPTNMVSVGASGGPLSPADRAAFIATAFQPFAPKVKTHADEKNFFVESDGMPAHRMMVGITAWQQQVPLPQSYYGDNAWQFPLWPTVAANPLSAKTHFFRGAIAIAANGVPIFNPIKNDGRTDTFLAGELDEFGGHAGRADDYHYHIAPLHLQPLVGPNRPVAFALDGYPIYGLTEPDGAATGQLDEFNGHATTALGYHYHATKAYPYLNGGFHGEVTERGGQVDPQPRAQSVRPATTPLRGAKIVGFTNFPDGKSFTLDYAVNGQAASVSYATNAGGWKFQFNDADGTRREQTYSPNGRQGGGESGGRRNGDQPGRPPRAEGNQPRQSRASSDTPPASVLKHTSQMVLRSPAVTNGGTLPVEFTGDGAGATLPLEWSGAPSGTKAFAVIMHHFPPSGGVKWYWTLYNIPAEANGLPKNTSGIGVLGNNSVNHRVGYAPPHSKGPGAKNYTITLYALAAPLRISGSPAEVDREVLLAAMKTSILARAELVVSYDRTEIIKSAGDNNLTGNYGVRKKEAVKL